MKVLYIWTFILLIAGLAIGFYLIPNREEFALIQLRGKRYSDAEAYYRSQYQKGVRTPDVVVGLESLELKKGDINQAIHILEEYVAINPDDLHALELLADLYLSAQQHQKYRDVLQQISHLKDSADVLKELALIYEAENQRDAYCSTLEKLVAINEAKSETYYALAQCYVERKEYEKALQIFAKRKSLFPKSVTLNDYFFEGWVIRQLTPPEVRKTYREKFVRLVIEFLREKNDPQLVYNAISIFGADYPEDLYFLISELQPIIQRHFFLEEASLQALWQLPEHQNDVIARLMELRATGKLTPLLRNLLFEALIAKKQESLLFDIVMETREADLEREVIYTISYLALTQNKPFLARQLQQHLGTAFLESHPLESAALAIGAKESHAKEQLEAILSKEKMRKEDLIFFFRLSMAASYQDLAYQIANRLHPYSGLQEAELFEITYVYIQMGKAEEFAQILSKLKLSSETTGASLAALNTSLGRTDRVYIWLRSQPKVYEFILQTLFSIAQEKREYRLGLHIAERLRGEYPSDVSTAFYGSALVYNGRPHEGLSLLGEAFEKRRESREIRDLYFNTLIYAVKTDRAYSADLKAFLHREIQEGSVKPDAIRTYAYVYLEDLKDYREAEQAFFYLAERNWAEKDDLSTLIYLWGPYITCEQKAWMLKRALCSSGELWEFWIENLAYVGSFEEVIELFESHCLSSLSLKVHFSYLDALSYFKFHAAMWPAIDAALCIVKKIEDFKRLAGYALQAEYLSVRSKIWEIIVSLEPENLDFWQAWGTALFDQHAYGASARVLCHFFELSEQRLKCPRRLYESLYQFGEILEFNRFYPAAKRFFLSSLFLIWSAPEKTYRMQEIESLIDYRLELRLCSVLKMRELFMQTAGDPEMAASFVNLLLDTGALQSAKTLIRGGKRCVAR
jgi:tetratricopeptide (TPR) repeat protein